MNEIKCRGLSGGSLFKVLFFGLLLSLGPLIIIFGICSIFGYHTIKVNDEQVTGIMGFVASLIMAPIFSVIFAGISWLFIGFGIWLLTRFKNLHLHFKEPK